MSIQPYQSSLMGTGWAAAWLPCLTPARRARKIIRTGPSVSVATVEQEWRLEERRVDRARTWDARACTEATLEDLSLELFQETYLARAVSREVLEENGRDISAPLGSVRFYHRKLGAPTNAAVLAIGKNQLSFFPGAYVQYVRYDGETQAASVRAERRLSGDIINVMRDLDRLAKEIANDHPVRRPDLADDSVADYPDVALHELFINAVIHRNYDGSTTSVSIKHYSKRVEVQNPGALYGDLSRDQFPAGAVQDCGKQFEIQAKKILEKIDATKHAGS